MKRISFRITKKIGKEKKVKLLYLNQLVAEGWQKIYDLRSLTAPN